MIFQIDQPPVISELKKMTKKSKINIFGHIIKLADIESLAQLDAHSFKLTLTNGQSFIRQYVKKERENLGLIIDFYWETFVKYC